MVPPSLYHQTEFCGPWLTDNPAPTHDAWRTLVDARGRPLIVIVSTNEPMVDRDFVSNAVTAALSQLPQPRVVVLELLQSIKAGKAPLPEEVLHFDLTPQTVGFLQSADLTLTRSEHTILWQLAAFGVPTIAVPTTAGFRGLDDTTDYALRSAKMGSCIYMPEVLATSYNLQVAIREVLETPLGARLRAASPQIDFAHQRRETANCLLRLANHADPLLKRSQEFVASPSR